MLRTAGQRVDFRVPGSNVLATRAETRNRCTRAAGAQEATTSSRKGLAGTGMVKLLDDLFRYPQ
jgi:hypothetical protein